MTHNELVEQVADTIYHIHGNRERARAAIAVVLEAAAQYADRNAAEAWGDKYARGLMRLQAEDIASAIRALATPSPSAAPLASS